MKHWIGYCYVLVAGFLLLPVHLSAQQQAIISVNVTGIAVGGATIPFSITSPSDTYDSRFLSPNESSGDYNEVIYIRAKAVGTQLIGSFTYSFFVNGVSIGVTDGAINPPNVPVVRWQPPQPGSYFITVTATDGTNTVSSLPVRYFATGTTMNSPVTNTIVPQGSSIVLKADATVAGGFIKQIQFYDNGVAIGSPDLTLPYSLIYTPPGASGSSRSITAQATDNDGNLVAMSSSITLKVVTPIPELPSSIISSPANNAPIAIPTDPAVNIPVAVDAFSRSGVINKVELYIDGVLFGTKTAYPYTFDWHPTVVGTYQLVALTYDDKNNVIASTTSTSSSSTPAATSVVIAAPPTVTVTSPSQNASVAGGSPSVVRASATSSSGTSISSVQFFLNGKFVTQTSDTTDGSTYTATVTFTQVKDKDGVVQPSIITALASDARGLSTLSSGVTVNVTDGGSSGPGTVIGIAPTVAVTAPTGGTQLQVGAPVLIAADAADADGNIGSVQFRVNGTSVGTDATYPYSVEWTPQSLGSYAIQAETTDNSGNLVKSTFVNVSVVDLSPAAPVVAITSPADGASFPVGVSQTLAARATSGSSIASVQFFVNGQPLGTPDVAAPFAAPWTPKSAGTFVLTARAIDGVGKQSTSAPVTVTIGDNQSPAVALISPASSTSVSAGNAVNLAATASDADGTIVSVRFLANGIVVGTTGATAPYKATWTPSAAGTYTVVAQATDNSDNVTTSAAVTVTVGGNVAPTTSITAPVVASSLKAGAAVTVTANAADANGTVTNVDFFANNVLIGTKAAPPYSTTWTPLVEGVYRLTSVATDNAGASTTSADVTVLVISATGTAADNVYKGTYSAGAETGDFAVLNAHGVSGVFIGYSRGTTPKVYFYPGLKVDAGLGFALRDTAGKALVAGNFSDTGVQGNFDSGRIPLFIGTVTRGVTGSSVPVGYYTGNLSGRLASTVAAIVAADGTVTLFVGDGSYRDAGAGAVASNGSFTINLVSGARLIGKVDGATGLLTGELTGGTVTGSAVAATTTGSTFSDGALRSLSTRGVAGTGDDQLLIAGFYVGGDTPKQVLVRAVGPTLSLLGVALPVGNPKIELYSGQSKIAENDNWSTPIGTRPASAATIAALSSAQGAFALSSGSLDAVVVATLAPGGYTALVRGQASSGVALVEVYDTDATTPFSPQKVLGLSTRGQVGTGENILIAGFAVSGSTAKKVLVRAIGPSLSQLGVTGVLANPVLRVVRMSAGNPVIRENDDWEVGNDAALVTEATAASGTFPLASGSKDAVILLSLPPGAYSAQVSGANGTTGVALVEVYEVR